MSEPTIHDLLVARGCTRREFLKLCAALAGAMGLRASPLTPAAGAGAAASDRMLDEVARALQSSPPLPTIWMAFQDCAGCTEALTRAAEPTFLDLLLDRISLGYHETLAAGSGRWLEEARQSLLRDRRGRYLLVVEGAVPAGDEGVFCTVGGRTALDLLEEAADGAKAIVAVGTCAAFGGIPRARPDPTSAHGVRDLLPGHTVLNIPGCPAVPDATAGTLAHLVVHGVFPETDALGRPLPFYGATIHDQCERRRFFRRDQFARSFDDDGARAGWCLLQLGCRGPRTYNACPRLLWGGISYPVQSGHPCLGCSEPGFWDAGELYARIPGPFEVFVPSAAKAR